ncbi:nuclear transport factor 2 family protein [Duganella sp. LX20W]|uniref:Nuclear transport factor 2 family protein n=1 Tax=Rugamonas brunnea TaxID=2758569 RepID=A0A7W2ICS2_9BURK|nr:nuclear transport factor 2 family protein [Rugamonas brunnea]MBA5638262.1 nuclear transport factor 2 family protein [Rugamonas brunnea]
MSDPEPLLAWYATLTPDTVGRAGEFYAPDAQFRDPFNNVCGVAAIEAIFRHMFLHTEQPQFIIGERIAQDDRAFVTWLFVFRLRGVPYQISGGSHLRFNAQGQVVMHRDYWDAAEELLQKLPLIGAPIRWLRGRFRVPLPAAATIGAQP